MQTMRCPIKGGWPTGRFRKMPLAPPAFFFDGSRLVIRLGPSRVRAFKPQALTDLSRSRRRRRCINAVLVQREAQCGVFFCDVGDKGGRRNSFCPHPYSGERKATKRWNFKIVASAHWNAIR